MLSGGVPRNTYIPFPFQIVQGRDKILLAYEYAGATRIVHMGTDLETTRAELLNVDTWNGQIGRPVGGGDAGR